MKIMFSAGEASGDTHGASVAKALLEKYPEAQLFGMGGDLMKQAGVDIIYDIQQLGFIGIVEILKHLPTFFKLRSFLKEAMLREKPDVLVCIDYPGFNMKLAKVAKELHIPVVYYIAPTIWAWNKGRGKDIAKTVTKVASIFPFEAEAYREFGVDVEFVGNPLVDIVHPTMSYESALAHFGADTTSRNILLMPGSRKQEVEGLLPTMLTAAERLYENHKDLKFFLPRAHTIPREDIDRILQAYSVPVTVTEGYNYDLMQICTACIAASGTATLETALMNVPTVLIYKVASLTYVIGKLLVNIDHIGLPNIMAKRRIIPELLQGEVTPENVERELANILDHEAVYTQMKADLAQVKVELGAPGAVQRVADVIASVAMKEA
ncbi:lipid-A-disaccharide synthase [Veillonella sp. VA142]|uniref:lipid-A-disaccharide synthase n=1 Tax=Veillonella sp. VA142 TaxID=741834 RepID=UPI00197ED544|nr:lipid-A-disaccharide synthase [Veillonella sp. VA142]